MVFSQFLVFPVVPFITKFNRYIVLGLLVVGKFGNNFKAIPDGFSREKGNYIYKDRNGISQLELDWNKEYHVGFEWLPDIDDQGGKSEWGHWFNLRKSNCQQERLVPVINSEFKVPQDLAFTNNCLTKLNHSKTTPCCNHHNN